MFIYKITNVINNKVYIGQTIRPIEERFKRHINDSLNNILDTHFARAIRKYGADNFIIEKIDFADSQNELNKKEQYWIRFYNSVINGYNETDAIYKSGGNTYQSKTSEELNIIADKIRQSKNGSLNPNAKEIKCKNIETDEELFFSTVKECKEYFKENTHRFITNRITQKTKVPYKGLWMIAYKENEYLYEPKHKTGKIINVVNLITKETQKYYSIREASRALNIDRSKIKNSLIINNTYKIIILN